MEISSFSISIESKEWPTRQISSTLNSTSFTVPLQVDGILATNLSVNTSTRSSNFKTKYLQTKTHLLLQLEILALHTILSLSLLLFLLRGPAVLLVLNFQKIDFSFQLFFRYLNCSVFIFMSVLVILQIRKPFYLNL